MSKKKTEQEPSAETATLPTYFREQILKSKKLGYSPDILRVVLKPDERYSLAEVESLVRAFKERKVI